MDVEEMVKNVNAECHPITNVDGIIRRWLDRGQKVIGSKSQWSWLRVFGSTLTTTAAISEYALSPLVDTSKLIIFYQTATPTYIQNMTEQQFRMFNPGPTATGDPYIYRLKGFSPVQNQPTSASTLSIVSSSSSDVTVGSVAKTVRVQGLNGSSVLVSETVTLTGTTPAVTTNSYSKIISLSKNSTTDGIVTITSNSGAVTNVVIPPNERTMSHPVVDFHDIPDSALTINYDFTMRLPTITIDADISLIPEQYHDAIELYAMARCYKHLNNPQMAQQTFGEFERRVKDMEDDDEQPGEVYTMNSFDSGQLPLAKLPANFPSDLDF